MGDILLMEVILHHLKPCDPWKVKYLTGAEFPSATLSADVHNAHVKNAVDGMSPT